MRVLIAISFYFALASAGYAGYYGGHGGYHVPVIGPHGVPIDEPAVQAAKAAHFAAHAKAGSYGGHGVEVGHLNYLGHAGDYGYAPKWHGPIHIPVIGPHGVPIDEPAVQHARAEHAAAHAKAGGHGLVSYAGHYGYAAPVAYGHGVPHDTPEVAAAKAAHFAAHAEAASRGAYHHYRKRRGLYYGASHGGYHVPQIGPHGVPIDEPAVQAAKAAHFAAHAEAAARSGYGGHGGDDYGYDGGAHYAYAGSYKYSGPLHYPVIGPHGVPVDEPAVQAARAHHAAAYAEAAARSGYHGYAHGHDY